mgnify:CR=1 FL=1
MHIPYVTGAWIPIRTEIYLDENWTQVYYNNVLIDDPALADHPTLGGGYSWTGGLYGQAGGALNIAAVDLYANGATPIYYDNMMLVGPGVAIPEPAAGLMTVAVLGFLLRRRR